MKTEKYVLYIGLNDKKTKTQEITTLEAVKVITNICVNYFGGCTISESTGYWINDNNEVTFEKTLKTEIITNKEDCINLAIANLKISLNQDSILKEKIISESDFM